MQVLDFTLAERHRDESVMTYVNESRHTCDIIRANGAFARDTRVT